jgi:hypothetical protein
MDNKDRTYNRFHKKISKAERLLGQATMIAINITGEAEEAEGNLDELRGSVRDVANYIEADDTTQIFTCMGADGEPEWNKEYIVFRLRDLIGECYTDEHGNER